VHRLPSARLSSAVPSAPSMLHDVFLSTGAPSDGTHEDMESKTGARIEAIERRSTRIERRLTWGQLPVPAQLPGFDRPHGCPHVSTRHLYNRYLCSLDFCELFITGTRGKSPVGQSSHTMRLFVYDLSQGTGVLRLRA
jgi:hypothetical protein